MSSKSKNYVLIRSDQLIQRLFSKEFETYEIKMREIITEIIQPILLRET